MSEKILEWYENPQTNNNLFNECLMSDKVNNKKMKISNQSFCFQVMTGKQCMYTIHSNVRVHVEFSFLKDFGSIIVSYN